MRGLLVAHPEHMEPVRTPRPWGNMTVPPLFGWENILVLLLLLVVLVVTFFVLTAAGPADSERQEWQRFLDARSRRAGAPTPAGPADTPSAERGHARERVDVLERGPSSVSDQP